MVATSRQPQRRQLESESGPGRRGGPLMRAAQPALACRVAQRPDLGEGGFTLVEFMIAALITTVVLGGTVALATQIQQGYSTQFEDAAVEQEARYALDWIARDLRSAGSNPYDAILPGEGVWTSGLVTGDSIRFQADVNPPDGLLDGDGEDVTIAIEGVGPNMFITRQDLYADDPAALPMTDAIFTNLSFTYLDASRVETSIPELVTYVRVEVTAQSRAVIPNSVEHRTATLATEVRLRTR